MSTTVNNTLQDNESQNSSQPSRSQPPHSQLTHPVATHTQSSQSNSRTTHPNPESSLVPSDVLLETQLLPLEQRRSLRSQPRPDYRRLSGVRPRKVTANAMKIGEKVVSTDPYNKSISHRTNYYERRAKREKEMAMKYLISKCEKLQKVKTKFNPSKKFIIVDIVNNSLTNNLQDHENLITF